MRCLSFFDDSGSFRTEHRSALCLVCCVILLTLGMIFFPDPAPAMADSTNGITTEMIKALCDQYGYVDGKTYWVYNEKKDKTAHPKLPDDWYVGSTDSSYKTSNQIGSGLTLSYRVGGYYECAGFTNFIGWKLTGVVPKTGNVDSSSGVGAGWKAYTTAQITSMGGLQPGDIIRNSTHSAVVYSVKSDGSFTAAQCYGSSSNKIRIGNAFNDQYSKLSSIPSVKYILRYQNAVSSFGVYTSTGTASNGFYRVKDGTGDLKEYPYADSVTKKTIKAGADLSKMTRGDVVEVVETVKNSYGNIWGKLSNGYFAYMGNLELLYTKVEDCYIKAFSTQKDIKELPFADAHTEVSIPSGMNVILVGKYKNKYGNIWYQLTDQGQGGYFVNENNLTNMQSVVTITMRSGSTWAGNSSKTNGYPTGNLNKGSSFGLRGIIDATENLATVTGQVINAATLKDALTPVTVKPNAKSLNIQSSNINNNLNFGNLPAGTYIYIVTATTTSGVTEKFFNSTFTVGGGTAASVKVSSIAFSWLGEGVSAPFTADFFTDDDIGKSFSLQAVAGPEYATNKNVTWSTSNSNVATYNASEKKIKIVGIGTAKLTVTAQDGSGVSSYVTVKVTCAHPSSTWKTTKTPTATETGTSARVCDICGTTLETKTLDKLLVKPTGITLNRTSLSLATLDTETLTATVTPSNATDKTVIWTSSNSAVAKISSSGVVTPVSVGTCTIKATSSSDATLSATATVTVFQPSGQYGDLSWRIDDTTLVIYGSGAMPDSAPSTLETRPWHKYIEKITAVDIHEGVTSVGKSAFENGSAILDVHLPSTITSIGDRAFRILTNLQGIELPESIISLGTQAFDGCMALEEITLPSGLKTVPYRLFHNCYMISSIVIPDGVTSIEEWAFLRNLGLQAIWIPDSVTSIHEAAFEEVSSSLMIYCFEGSAAHTFAIEHGYSYQIIGGSCGDNVKWEMTGGEERTASVGNTLRIFGNGPMKVYGAQNAPWSDIDFQHLVIESGVTSIIGEGFQNCPSLLDVWISDTVRGIDAYVFTGDTRLKSILVDENNPEFTSTDGVLLSRDGTSLISFPQGKGGTYYVPNSVTLIKTGAFEYATNVSEIILQESDEIITIDRVAFVGCDSIVEIMLPSNVRFSSTVSLAFDCASLANIYVAEEHPYLKSIDGIVYSKDMKILYACPQGKMGKVQIPEGVEEIADTAFIIRNIEEIIMPHTIRKVGWRAFFDCRSLEKVTIPYGLESLGAQAFVECESLREIMLPNSLTEIGEDCFDKTTVIQCYEGSKALEYAKKYGYQYEILGAFDAGQPNVMEQADFVLPNGLVTIEEEAFSGIAAVKIRLPESVSSIGAMAFAECNSLKQIYIPYGCENIAANAFGSLTSITIYGKSGSYAEWFAGRHGFSFVAVEP